MFCIKKIRSKRVKAVIIAPVWQNQVWYLKSQEIMISKPTINAGNSAKHIMGVSPTHDRRPPPTNHMACIRQSFSAREFSQGVIGILKKSWRDKAYVQLSLEKIAQLGVASNFSSSEPILELLFKQFNAGKQYWTLNTIQSATLITQTEVDGSRDRQHEIVSYSEICLK